MVGDNGIEAASQTALYGGTAATWTIMGLGLPEVAAIITAFVALVGAAVNIVYVWNKNRRAEAAHRLEMEALRGKINGVRSSADDKDAEEA